MKSFLTSWRAAASRAFMRWGWVAGFLIVGVVLFFCAGCKSGTKEIARAAGNTTILADRIDEHSRALEPVVEGNKEASQHLAGIKQATADIRVEVSRVHEALPKVKDVQPWWAQMLENATWIILGCGVLFALFYFGLAAPIRAFFVFIGSFVPAILPPKAKAAAKMDNESLEVNWTPELDKTITVRRASDPMYDAAWKAMRRKEQKQAAKDVPAVNP